MILLAYKKMSVHAPSVLVPLASSTSAPNGNLYFRDPIYGLIELSAESSWIILTPLFQRLKNLRQLGALDFVFPYAGHRRFEHSLGVAYLARMTGKYLQKNNSSISNRQVLQLELAGLLHDVGHGPYSHVFDHFLEDSIHENPSDASKPCGIELVRHEVRSQVIVEKILSERPDLFDKSDTDAIQFMIDPVSVKDQPCEDWMTHIISNKLYGVDVDKLDYLLRDAQYLRYDIAYTQFNPLHLLSRTRIVDGIWMFNIQDQGLIYDLICRRLLLHTNRYAHPTVHAASQMISDIFKNSNHVYKFQEIIGDISRFEKLDDSIIEDILNNSDPTLTDAKDLINRLLNKEFYEHIGDYHHHSDLDENIFTEIKWKIYSDKSSPLLLLPKVRYHFNGKEVKNDVTTVYRLYKKDLKI